MIIAVCLILIVFNWFSVCGADYDYDDCGFLDFSTRAGEQFMWVARSSGLGFVLLTLKNTLYGMFSYVIYVGLILLLTITIFIAPDTKGSCPRSILGPISLQPAELAKFIMVLVLAKYVGVCSSTVRNWENTLMLVFLVLLSLVLIIPQRETGSASVYTAFSLMFYRESIPGVVLFSGICTTIYFVVGIRFDQVLMTDTPTPIRELAVLSMMLFFIGGVV